MNNVTEPDGRKLRGQRTRRAIIAAALEVLGQHGKVGFTARVVAEHAGISKAALFHHFPTMDDVVRATFLAILEQFDDMATPAKTTTLEQYIQDMLEGMLAFMASQTPNVSGYFQVIEMMRANDALRPELETFVENYQAAMAQMFGTLAGKRGDPDRIRRAITMISAYTEGMGVLLATYNPPVDFEETFADYASMLGRYIRGES